MRAPGLAYLSGASGVFGASVASAAAGFASLWLLTRILSVESFGGYAFAMAVLVLASVLATLGLDRSLLLRVAAIDPSGGRLRGAGLARRTLAVSMAAALVSAGALRLGAGAMVDMGMVPEARFWLQTIGIAAVPLAGTMVLQTWYQANHRVALATVMPGVADLSRCLLFAAVLLLGLGAAGVAASVTLAAAVPFVLLVWWASGRTEERPRRLRYSDLVKGWQFLTLRLAQEGTRHVDLVMLGFLATGTATAEFAVAARIAALADQGRLALSPTFTPRVRRWIAAGDRPAALREFARTRDLAFAAALGAAAAFVLLGDPVLSLFGPFAGAYPVLVLVSLAFVLNAGFGMHAPYLAMHGEVGWSAALRFAGLGLHVALSLALIPPFGAVGAALAAVVSQLTLNVAGAGLAKWLTGLKALDGAQALLLCAAAATMGAAAPGLIAPPLAALALALLCLLAAWRCREVLGELVRMVAARRPR